MYMSYSTQSLNLAMHAKGLFSYSVFQLQLMIMTSAKTVGMADHNNGNTSRRKRFSLTSISGPFPVITLAERMFIADF